MPVPGCSSDTAASGQGWFATTHWSVVLAAGSVDAPNAAAALEQLCRAYWYPLYSYARRLGHGPQDAEDLTQGFFAYFLQSGLAAKPEPERGRFRSFLLAAFKHFRSGEWDKAQAQRRGGGREFISWELYRGEDRFAVEPVESRDPEAWYEWNWAMALLDTVLGRLASEFDATGRQRLFEALKQHLLGQPTDQTYSQLASSLGKTEAAIKEAVRRIRLRYRELFRDEVARTVQSPAEVDDELRRVIAILRG